MGYHERIDTQGQLPDFLKDLRSTALARTFSGDKNVSIFLGRPPRIHSKYCEIRGVIDGIAPQVEVENLPEQEVTTRFSYLLESWWTASCALLKEQVLDVPKNAPYEQRLGIARFVNAAAFVSSH